MDLKEKCAHVDENARHNGHPRKMRAHVDETCVRRRWGKHWGGRLGLEKSVRWKGSTDRLEDSVVGGTATSMTCAVRDGWCTIHGSRAVVGDAYHGLRPRSAVWPVATALHPVGMHRECEGAERQ